MSPDILWHPFMLPDDTKTKVLRHLEFLSLINKIIQEWIQLEVPVKLKV